MSVCVSVHACACAMGHTSSGWLRPPPLSRAIISGMPEPVEAKILVDSLVVHQKFALIETRELFFLNTVTHTLFLIEKKYIQIKYINHIIHKQE